MEHDGMDGPGAGAVVAWLLLVVMGAVLAVGIVAVLERV